MYAEINEKGRYELEKGQKEEYREDYRWRKGKREMT